MPVISPDLTIEADDRALGDVTHFWRVPRYRGLECLRATFRRHAYARHSHETYAIAAIVDGCETFFHRGEQRYAGTGSVAVVCPDEIHDGEPYGGGFAYRTLYPSVDLMREVAEELTGKPQPQAPWFRHSIVEDPDLVAALTRLHTVLEHADAPTIERDERLIGFLSMLITRWADRGGAPPIGAESRAIARARDYLDAHVAEEVELADAAQVAGLSRAHFIRAFRRETGLTPHAYLLDRRFRAAERLLEQGEAPGEVAAACGFFDQSHLNRVFKARKGVTPGVYRAA